MSTLRISNIEAKSVPASATIDEKVKITNSSGDVLVFLDGKTSGITTVGINTTDGNITFDANSNVVVTGIITASKFVGTFEPTNLTLTGDLLVPDKIVHTGDTNTAIRFPAADTISFETSGGERLRIDSRGDVYLSESTSLSSPYSSFHNLSIGNNLILNAYTGGNGGFAGMQHNAYLNSSGNWERVYNDHATSIGTDNGNFYFRNTGAGTGNISWSTPLTISSDGALLLGTTTRSNLENLHIHTASSDKAIIKFTNTGTGQGTGDGFEFGLNSNEDVELMLKENKNIIFGTGATTAERLRIGSTGETTLVRLNTFPNPNNTGSEILGGKLVFGSNISLEERYPNGAYVDRQDLVLRTNTGYGQGQSDKIRFTAGGTINFETSGGGLHFGAMSNVAGMTSETLDDYEEGQFTPTLSGGTTANNMYYTKIGRVVYISGSLAFNSISGSGVMAIGGLPYTSINGLDSYTHLAAHAYDSLNVGNQTYQYQTLRVDQNSTTIRIIIPAGNGDVRTFGSYSHVSGSTFRYRVAGYYITA